MWLRSLIIVGLLASLAACGRGTSILATSHSVDGLKLTVLPDSFVPGGSGSFHLSVTPEGDRLRADVVADHARGLKALYFNISYDTSANNPLSVEATGALWPAADAQHPLIQLG